MELDHKEPCVLTWEVRTLSYRELLKDVKQGSGIRLIIQKGFSGSSIENGLEVQKADWNLFPSPY